MDSSSKIDRLIAQIQAELTEIETRQQELRAHLQQLKQQKEACLAVELESQRSVTQPLVNRNSPELGKIQLFRSLFKGREDIYARRFESKKSGKIGYQPVCRHEWIRGLCQKPRTRCGDCRNRDFLPITDEVIRNHLLGRDINKKSAAEFVIGVYPLLPDDTCCFLAIDFDGAEWMRDTSAFLHTCSRFHVPAASERSRSGNGGHTWIFFTEPVAAALARQLGSLLLTETMEKRPELGFKSYDRLFPSQNTMPKGGFGNLIALPLQKLPREKGNTLFLDENFIPLDDQWAYLSSIRKMLPSEAENIVQEGLNRGRILGVRAAIYEEVLEPWSLPPSGKLEEQPIQGLLPDEIALVLANEVFIAKDGLPPGLLNRLIRLAAFQNPEFYKAQFMRLPTYDKPRIISCCEDYGKYIGLPRGCLEDILRLFDSLKIRAKIIDERFRGNAIEVSFQGSLNSQQEMAASVLLDHDIGVLSAPTAFGKTVIAAHLIAKRRVNTLVLVHRKQLLDQWLTSLKRFLKLGSAQIGHIGGGKNAPSKIVDVAIIQSLSHKGIVKDLLSDYGQLIVDECHHISARSFEVVVRRCKAKYVTGLSATVTRKDGHQPIIFMQCGPLRYSVGESGRKDERPFGRRVIVRRTHFELPMKRVNQEEMTIHSLYSALSKDSNRNQLIIEDVIQAVRRGRVPVVLTERREHLQFFVDAFKPLIDNVFALKGGVSLRTRERLNRQLAGISESEQMVLVATGRYLGEGFDYARLDTLFLALPVSWRGVIIQYAGRLHRLYETKREALIFDYLDTSVPMLLKMFQRRQQGYADMGYEIQHENFSEDHS